MIGSRVHLIKPGKVRIDIECLETMIGDQQMELLLF